MASKAGLLIASAFFPGVGQAYKRRWRRAIVWALACFVLRGPIVLLLSAFGIFFLGFQMAGGASLPLWGAGLFLVVFGPGLIAGWDALRLEEPVGEEPRAGFKRGVAFTAGYLLVLTFVVGPWFSAFLLSRGSKLSTAQVKERLDRTPDQWKAKRVRGWLTQIPSRAATILSQAGAYGTADNPGDCALPVVGSLFSAVGHPASPDPRRDALVYAGVVRSIESFRLEAPEADMRCYSTARRYAVAEKMPTDKSYFCLDSAGRQVEVPGPISGPSCDPKEASAPDPSQYSPAPVAPAAQALPVSPTATDSMPPAVASAPAVVLDPILEAAIRGRLGQCRVGQWLGACHYYVKVGDQGFPTGAGCAQERYASAYGCTGPDERVAACLLKLALKQGRCR